MTCPFLFLGRVTKTNIVSSLMTNFGTAREALDTSLNSAGSAMREHEKWQQSLEAQINSLKASWQGLSQAFLSSDFLKVTLNTVIGLVDVLNKLIDTFGALPTILGTVAAGFSLFKNKGFFKVVTDEATGAAKSITTIFSNAATKASQSLSQINLKGGFRAGLSQNDIGALRDYGNALERGVSSATAWNNCMANASDAAKDAARSNEFLAGGLTGYIKSQQAANISTLASNKSLGSARVLLKEYYSGCKTTGMGVNQFKEAVQQTNPQLAAQMTATGSATSALVSYTAATAAARAGAFLLKVGVLALNAALTMGISLIVSGLLSAISKWFNAEEELAEKVEEVTTKYKEQSEELQKLKGNYDTSREDSMISRYGKLSKGVDRLGRNISLTTDEYSEYQSIVSQIAEQIPSLVSGYTEQGNAILSCADNVDKLRIAYQQLMHEQNETTYNDSDIQKNWQNAVNQRNGYDLWEAVGNSFASVTTLLGFDVSTFDMKNDTAEFLKKVADGDYSEDKIDELLGKVGSQRRLEIIQALQEHGHDVGVYTDISEYLYNLSKNNRKEIDIILKDYYAELDDEVSKYKTMATALLRDAFDVDSSISGMNYSNIGENLQAVVYQVVNGLDTEFLTKLTNSGETINEWVEGVLYQLNNLNESDNTKIESALDLQTQFNGGEISYGEYVDGLKDVEKTIDGLKLNSRVKSQLKMSLGLDDNGIIEQYNNLLNRLTDSKNYDFNIGKKEAEAWLNSLSSEDLALAVDIITETSDNGVNETIAQLQAMLDKEKAILGLSLEIDIETEKAKLESLATAISESVSGAGLSTESLDAIEAMFGDMSGYNPSKLFERTANGIRLNTEEFRRLNSEYKKSNVRDLHKEMNTLGDAYIQTREELSNLTYGTDKYNEKAAELQNIEDQINAVEKFAAGYEGLASAYQEWQMVESAGSQRDMYEGIIAGFENMDDEMSRGWLDDGTIEFLELLTGRTDLAYKSSKELEEVYNSLDDKIGKSGYSIRDFFTVNEDGDSTNAGVYNFLETVETFEDKLGDVVQRKDGNIVGFNFNVAGGDEAIAEALGISEELVQIMVRAADDAGFVVSMDGTYQQLDILVQKAQDAAKTLKNTFKVTNYDFFQDGSEEGVIKDYQAALKLWESFKKNKNADGTVNMSVKGAQEAFTLVSTLQSMVDQLNEPVYMELNTSDVEKEMQTPLSKLQEYERLTQTEHQLKLKGTDTSQIDKDKKEILDYFQNLSPEIKADLGINGDSRAELEKKLEDGEITIPATVDLQVEMNDTLKDMVNVALYNAGIIEKEELEKRVDVNVYAEDVDTSDVEDKVEDANKRWYNLFSLPTSEKTTSTTKENNAVKEAESFFNKFEDKNITIKVDVKGIDKIKQLNSQIEIATNFDGNVDKLSKYTESVKTLKNIGENVSSYVTAEIKGNVVDEFEYKINNLKVFSDSAKDLGKIGFVKSEVSANVNGNVIDKFEYKINNLKAFSDSAKDIVKIGNVESNVKANVSGNVIDKLEYKLNNLEKFSKYAKELQGLQDVDININATVNTGNDGDVVDEFEYKLNNLSVFANYVKELQGLNDANVSVNAEVNTGDNGDAIDEFEYKLDNLEVFAQGAKALQGVGNVTSKITAEVNTGESGDAVDTFEYKLNNLETFAQGAKALQGIGDVSTTITAKINSGSEGDVVEEFEYKLNNLEKFAKYASDLQGVGNVDISVSAKINTGENGDVVDTFEYKLNNLDEFASYAKNLQGLNDVNISIKANVDTGSEDSVINEFEYKLNNLDEFTSYAKELQGLKSVEITVSANAKGNVVGKKTESKINNLEVFAKGAKSLNGIENKKVTVTANAKGNVVGKKTESKINNLEVFAQGAKKIQNLKSKTVTITADAKGNVVGDKTEGKIKNIKVFGDSAKALNGVKSKEVTVTANAEGNVISGEGSSKRLSSLTEFKSLTNGMSNKTVIVTVTANVDSENVNKAIKLLKDVSSSGVFKDYKATVQVGAKVATIDDTVVDNYKAPKKDGKVAYSVDPESSVFTWTAPDKTGVVNYSAHVEALTDAQKNKTGTITYKAKVSGVPEVNGTANANGSAFANGTTGKAYQQGDWGVKKTTTALTGELGRELVVYRNRFWTVGDNGAEFATIPKGAIVFNHKILWYCLAISN